MQSIFEGFFSFCKPQSLNTEQKSFLASKNQWVFFCKKTLRFLLYPACISWWTSSQTYLFIEYQSNAKILCIAKNSWHFLLRSDKSG